MSNTEAAPRTVNRLASGVCDACLRSRNCLGAALHASTTADGRPDNIHVVTVQRGQPLYRVGEATTSAYVVQSGALKVRRHSAAGDEEIIAFRQPGDTTGLESLGHGAHAAEAVALSPTKVCRLPLQLLKLELLRSAELGDRLLQEMGREFKRMQMRMQRERQSAPARVASFLLGHLQHRRELFGNAIDSFSLPMSRSELGRFLALAPETVSRVFARLQQDGIVASENHTVRILDVTMLTRVAEHNDAMEAQRRAA